MTQQEMQALAAECRKLLGDTLDEDFGFWSLPTHAKQRLAVFGAYTKLETLVDGLAAKPEAGGYSPAWLHSKIAALVYRAKVEPARESHESGAVADRIMRWVELYQRTTDKKEET